MKIALKLLYKVTVRSTFFTHPPGIRSPTWLAPTILITCFNSKTQTPRSKSNPSTLKLRLETLNTGPETGKSKATRQALNPKPEESEGTKQLKP